MGIFVLIESGDDWSGDSSGRPRFVGELVVDQIQPVANYELVDLSDPAQPPNIVARLEGYPRWAEPGLALVARLIERSDPNFLDKPVHALPVTLDLSVGTSPADTTLVEQLFFQRAVDGYGITLASRVRQAMIRATRPSADMTLRELVLECARGAFGWNRHCGPLPAALNEVPLQQGELGAFVLLADIPWHPRSHFALLYGLRDGATAAPARLWLEFIGAADTSGAAEESGEAS